MMLKVNKAKATFEDTKCVICLHPETTKDGNFYWCRDEICDARRRVLAWLRAHDYRELKYGLYAIGSGQYCAQVACMMGSEEMVMQALAYIECLESDEG